MWEVSALLAYMYSKHSLHEQWVFCALLLYSVKCVRALDGAGASPNISAHGTLITGSRTGDYLTLTSRAAHALRAQIPCSRYVTEPL